MLLFLAHSISAATGSCFQIYPSGVVGDQRRDGRVNIGLHSLGGQKHDNDNIALCLLVV